MKNKRFETKNRASYFHICLVVLWSELRRTDRLQLHDKDFAKNPFPTHATAQFRSLRIAPPEPTTLTTTTTTTIPAPTTQAPDYMHTVGYLPYVTGMRTCTCLQFHVHQCLYDVNKTWNTV